MSEIRSVTKNVENWNNCKHGRMVFYNYVQSSKYFNMYSFSVKLCKYMELQII